MSKVRTEINESLTSMVLFLRLYKTFQIGDLASIIQQIDEDSSIYENKELGRMFSQFIFHVNEANRKYHTQKEYLALIIVESLIYNLYRHHINHNSNSSMYSNSLLISSCSQIGTQSEAESKNMQNVEQNLPNNFVAFVKDFIFDPEMAKKIKQMNDRGARKAGEEGVNRNQRYIDVIFETVEYILSKQGSKTENSQLLHLKQMFSSKNTTISNHFQKKTLKNSVAEVNKIIFSSKLNRIIFILEEADETLYFSLLRIYFAQMPIQDEYRKKIGKYFKNISYTGQQMILNLTWAYVDSIQNKNQLFQSSKNPLFRLIQNYLLCFYMPTFRIFNNIVAKCCKYDFDGLQFYKVCENIINKDFFDFIQSLSNGLIDYLRQIYKIILISESKKNKKEQYNISLVAMTGVKKLLIYSFLAKPTLIQTYYSEGDIDKYEQSCNNLINLFFKASLKKYQSFQSSQQIQLVSTLTRLISNKFEQKIQGTPLNEDNQYFDDFQKPFNTKDYILQEPILNHDYQIVSEKIKTIEFTPKDLRQFQMHKKSALIHYQPPVIPASTNTLNLTGQLPNFPITSPRQQWNSPMIRPKKDSLDSNFNESAVECFEIGNQQTYSPPTQQVDYLTWMTVGGNKDYQLKSMASTSYSQNNQRREKKMKSFQSFPKDKMREISKLYESYERILL